MSCSTCGGNHVGSCPGVSCKCIICGREFVAGNGWHNHYLCSVSCCEARRAELAPPEEDDDLY